ncbi:uncharacterized protein LY89DRAFT_639563 [Mollisia scopiformis]|uniref:Uncharacterized protein n=1 Tax=Mollisia scopiformis TaxID=149040 RepID=A0A194XJ10_MOLSC|nr:uncharacterized protein LY89DRAFT_639563 [Mollisia scopiformis]KUJ20235.1 hypothetical protein LY89DRAFT_639563 [Mollisia scopiformis]
MATAPVGHAAVAGQSLNQFRLIQFGGLSNATTADARSPAPIPDASEQMAQARPPSGQNQERIPSAATSRTKPLDHNPTHSPSGLGGALDLVELTSNPTVEGILGPNKDGRVRNPVPSKLKGKTDNNSGAFGVMSMGMSPGKKNEGQGKDAAAERDAAARRTSENTASRAKAAQSEKYVPPKKRGLEASLDGPSTSRGSPFSRDDHKQRGRPLAPDETKIEQARLLTLLRSINPVTVVDQICKAVAYFGGIPGAPPPEDGIFPESANTRETGALFIGWLAEIFPDVTARSPEIPRDVMPGAGKKKGKQTKGNRISVEGDASHEPPNSRNGYGFGPAVSAPAWGLPPSLGLVNTPQMTPIPLPETRIIPNNGPSQNKQPEQQSPATPIKQQLEEHNDGNTSTNKRRRGRPKGSRNKGRGEGGSEGFEPNAPVAGQTQGQQGSESPQAQAAVNKPTHSKTSVPAAALPAFTPVANNQATTSKPHQTLQYSEQSWPNNFQQNQTTNPTNLPQVDELSPEEKAVIEAFRHHGPEAANAVPSPITTSKPPPEAGQKRKRAPPKPKPAPTSVPAFQPEKSQSAQKVGSLGNVPSGNESPLTVAKEGLQWAAVEPTPQAAPPPAKRPRQRKPKAPSTNDPPSRNQTASIVNSATPPIPPSTIPDSQATASQQSIPPSRPPAEGLEAHYERFVSLQQQQNGRSTPSLYGSHQASPQMSNNSYRSSSTHTLAQASPQFSQAENTYRTASPHTLAQPSPSFSQSDTTFRNTNTQNITQPSPSYSQAENPYRTPSTHSMAQPTPSYTTTRSHPQTQPSHQNHYSHFSDSTYIDLPTLESLGHAGSSNSQSVGLATGNYGQGMSVGLGTPARSSASSNTLYGSSSGLNSAFDANTNDLLRGVSRSTTHTNSAYGTSPSGLGNAFDTGPTENEMRERLLRGFRR